MVTDSPDIGLGDVFVSLADSLRPGYNVVDTLDLLVHAATTHTSAVEAGVLLVGPHCRLQVGASSAERATDVEEEQLGVDGGPCVDAIRSGAPLEVLDIEVEGWRWPAFAIVARARGFRAVHAIPLQLRGQTLGGLNLFSEQPGAFDDRDFAVASAMVQIAAISIVQHQSLNGQSEINAQLQQALETRTVIEQAKGIISQQRGVPVEEAFGLLRRHSRNNQRGLKEIAALIVEQQLVLE